MAYELGTAYINITPKMDGAGRAIERELSGVGARAGSSKGNSLGGKLWGGLKAGAVGAGVAIGGVLTGSVVKGFRRLTAIEDAEAKLRGLGNSAEDVEAIMDNALAAVKGTAFGMDEAATTAASAVAAGIKPGKELESYLRLVGDAAAIAGTDMSSMGSIFNKVATSGKVQGDVFAQLGDAGIPIVTLLAEEMGVTAEEVYKLGSAGKIGTDEFLSAMEAVGGSALEMGNTTSGAWRNMGAAMSRFGATLLSEVYPYVAPLLTRVTELFDYLGDKAGPAIERVMGSLKEWAQSDQVQGFMGRLRDVAVELYKRALVPLWEKALKPFGEWWLQEAPKFLPTIGKIAGAIGVVVGVLAGGALAAVIGSFMATVAFAVGVVWPILTRVVDFIQNTLWPVIKTVFGAVKAATLTVWEGVVLPAFQKFSAFIQDTVMPIVQRLWSDYIQPAFKAIGGAAVWLWDNAIKPAFSAIVGFVRDDLGPALVAFWENVVSPVFSAIGKFISWSFENVIFPVLDVLKHLVTVTIPDAFNTMRDFVLRAWSAVQARVQAVVSWFQTWVWPVIEMVIELIKRGFNIMRDALKTAWNFIKDRVIAPVVNWFRDTAWPVISTVIDSIKSGFNTMRDVLRTAWNTIRDRIIAPVANWFRDKIEPLFKRATDSTGSAYTSMKDSIKKAWDGVKNAAKAPVKFVVQTVINDALIGKFNRLAKKLGTGRLPPVSLPSGFARGGVLPGMSRMRDGDDQLVPMRRGEGVLVSEALRTARDRAAFLAVNAAGRRGVGFADHLGGGFAGGGIWDGIKGGASKAWKGAKGLAGDALDKVLDGADFVAEALKDPAGIFTRLYDSVVGKMPAAGLMGDAAKGVGKKLLNGVIDTVKGALPSFELPSLGAIKSGGSLAMAQGLARSFGLTMTSFRRPGARTAGSGSLSLHAQGRAMDFSNSSGPTPQMMAFFNAMHPFKPTELLYSPAGARQWRRSGRMADTSGATKRGHYNHVHVGFAEGGILGGKPFLHDRGGWHNPGELSINQTRKPEAVLTNAQWRTMSSLVGAVSGGNSGNTYHITVPADPNEDRTVTGRRIAEVLDFRELNRKVAA